MSIQTSYNYQLKKGTPGGLYDLSPHLIDSRANGEESKETLKFGMGVVVGATPGADVLVPTAASVEADFEGLVVNGGGKELDMSGILFIQPRQTIDVLRWGRLWALIVPETEVAYGDPLYLVNDGDNAGMFTNDDGGGANLPINGKFIGGLGTDNVAPVEIYNQKA